MSIGDAFGRTSSESAGIERGVEKWYSSCRSKNALLLVDRELCSTKTAIRLAGNYYHSTSCRSRKEDVDINLGISAKKGVEKGLD